MTSQSAKTKTLARGTAFVTVSPAGGVQCEHRSEKAAHAYAKFATRETGRVSKVVPVEEFLASNSDWSKK